MEQQQPPINVVVTELKPYDVLLGRGNGPNQYIGNQRFRDVVNEYKVEYNTSGMTHKAKQKIAEQVLARIHSSGGRFLKRPEDHKLQRDKYDSVSVQEETWYVVDDKEAVQKCKTALRDKRIKPSPPVLPLPPDTSSGADNNNSSSTLLSFPASSLFATASLADNSSISGMPMAAATALSSSSSNVTASSSPTINFWTLPSALLSTTRSNYWTIASALGAAASSRQQSNRPLSVTAHHPSRNSHTTALTSAQTHLLLSSAVNSIATTTMTTTRQSAENNAATSSLGSRGTYHHHSAAIRKRQPVQQDIPPSDLQSDMVASLSTPRNESSSSSCAMATTTTLKPEDDDVSEFLLSVLALSGRSKFTEEEERQERESMTNEERAKVLSDLFGKYCTTTHSNKRAKQDLDDESISFLVQQMRREIDNIPISQKQAYVKAQQECRAHEFRNDRLEQFLRCVGMDVQLAAQRFVNYWQCRLDVFGPEKYTMRMTLSEALKDDLTALETAVFYLLPHLDASGRPIVYMDPPRHTREGYSSQSLLRAIWYIYEVAAEDYREIRSSVVVLVWFRDFSLWDYDRIYDRLDYFETSAWPVRYCAVHACCPPSIVHRILKPVIYALKDKESRSRTIIHDVPDNKIVDALSSYGITKNMLPVEMGGSLEFDQKEWIADRRAAELEEI